MVRGRGRLFASTATVLTLMALGAAAGLLPGAAARAWAVGGGPRKADVIVVLGGGVVWPGELACDSLQRLQHGVWLYHRGYAPRLVVTGGAKPGSPAIRSEAELMRDTALMMGVRPEDVLMETRASRTRENGTEVAAIMKREGWRSALLVTNALHMRRSRMVFERLHIQTYPAPSYTPGLIFATPGQWMVALEETGYEVLATAFYRLRGWA